MTDRKGDGVSQSVVTVMLLCLQLSIACNLYQAWKVHETKKSSREVVAHVNKMVNLLAKDLRKCENMKRLNSIMVKYKLKQEEYGTVSGSGQPDVSE